MTNIRQFKRTRSNKRRRRSRGQFGPRFAVGFVAFLGISGYLYIDRNLPDRPEAHAAVATAPAERAEYFPKCAGSKRYTCVVDGDTIWLDGQNLRLQSVDTPEPFTNICGGETEKALARRASDRLLELLNGNRFTVETFGIDGTGERTLATIRIGGRDVGDILIEEGLARRWPDGDEWWCRGTAS